MAKRLQLRGGTTAQHSTFTGALREVTVDTDKDTLVVHDGSTAGGFPLAKYSDVTAISTDLVNDTTPQLGGNLDLNSNDITGTGNINITGTATVTGLTSTGNIILSDSDKIRLGNSQDLEIFHDGTNSYLQDVGTGELYIKGSSSVHIYNVSDNEPMAVFNKNGSVDLYYDNSKKFETTSTGVDITGTLLADKGYIAETTLTDGATISWDMSTQSVAKVTLGGNRTIAAPTNGSTGQFASLLVAQDGTGGRTLTWNAVYEFASDTAPTLTATASLGDLFVFRYNGSKWLEVGRNLALTLS